jgi:hypothetical protein
LRSAAHSPVPPPPPHTHTHSHSHSHMNKIYKHAVWPHAAAQISSPGYVAAANKWLNLSTFPATVLAALDDSGNAAEGVAAGQVFFSQNLKLVQTSRFDVHWFYRTLLPDSAASTAKAGGLALLTFQGLNYRANIWVNGKLLASNATIAGLCPTVCIITWPFSKRGALLHQSSASLVLTTNCSLFTHHHDMSSVSRQWHSCLLTRLNGQHCTSYHMTTPHDHTT